MYQVYVKSKSAYEGRKLVGEYKDYDLAYEKAEEELAKDENIKYVIEETTGAVDVYGNLIVDVVDEN